MNKVYIAGPMTGHEYFNFHAFDDQRDNYLAKGFEVFNPADHDRELLGKPQDWYPDNDDHEGSWKYWAIEGAPSLRTMLGDDLAWIAKNATHIHILKGWENSRGARAEHALAVALDLEIRYS